MRNLSGLNLEFSFSKTITKLLPYYFAHRWRQDCWIHTFSKDIRAMWKANSLVCMYVRTYVCMYVYAHTLTHIYIYIYKHMCIYIYKHIHTSIYMYRYIYIYIYTIYTYIYIDYRDIYSPTIVGLSSLENEVIVLPLAFTASLFIYELRSR